MELTERMARITGELKTYARQSPVPLGAVSLHQALDNALATLSGRVERDRVALRIPARTFVQGELMRLEQVLVNLLKNGFDAMADQPRPRMRVCVARSARRVRVFLRDHGPGIRAEHFDSLFDPFFTTKEVGAGLGLGLSISYGIVRNFGGALRARNHPRGGALFALELARAPAGDDP